MTGVSADVTVSADRKRSTTVSGLAALPLFDMEKENEITNEEFHKKKRHLILLTEAGKPVYSRWGDEAEISPIVATLSVIVNKLRNLKGDGSLKVHRIENNLGKTLIYHKHNLYMVYITKDKKDNDFMVERLSDMLFH